MRARQVGLLVLALVMSGVLGFAQGVPKFRPFSHLDQWIELTDGETGDLFRLEAFIELKGRTLNETELKDVRELWLAERDRVQAVLAAINSDPHEKAVRALLKKLADHPYIGQIDYTRVDTFKPFVFMVQRPPKDNPGYADGVADFYGPWFQVLESIYQEQFAQPLGFERRADTPYVIFVLGSRGAYDDLGEVLNMQGHASTRAHYNPELQIAITYRNLFGREANKNQTERKAALHELVHAMQHAHYPQADNLPANPWLNEGLAEYLSAVEAGSQGILREHYSGKEALETILGISTQPEIFKVVMFPIEELLMLTDYGHVIRSCVARAVALGAPRVDYADVGLGAFYAQASLWVHFLRHGEKGRYRESFDRFVGEVQKGEIVADAFAANFGDVEYAQLDRQFRKHVNHEGKARLKFSNMPKLSGSPFRMGGKALAASAPRAASGVFQPTRLLPPAGDLEVEFAVAIGAALSGAYGSARDKMEALSQSTDVIWKRRATKELVYIELLLTKRLAFLEHLQRSGKKLKLRNRVPVIAKIEKIEGGTIFLDRNPRGADQIEMDQIDPVELASLMATRKYKFDHGLAPAYIYLLAGDERWSKSIKAKGEQADELKQRSPAEYSTCLQLGRDVRELVAFAELGVPTDPEGALATFESISTLAQRDSRLLKSKRAVLTSYARATLVQVFEGGGIERALKGQVEQLSKGRLRVTYPFQEEAELQDFTDCVAGRGTPSPYGQFDVFEGTASATDDKCIAHVLPFQGAQVIRFRYRYVIGAGQGSLRYGFSFGFNGDQNGFGVALNIQGISANAAGGYSEALALNLPDPDLYTRVELRYDGKRFVEVLINGKQRGRLDCGPVKSGNLYLHTFGNATFELSELSIEGDLTPDALSSLRDNWIDAELKRAGL